MERSACLGTKKSAGSSLVTAMGIKGLYQYLSRSSNARTMHPFLKYRTKTFAIDANILIYKFCYVYSQSISSFLECFIYKITSFLKFGIFPVFVFDGRAPIEKQPVIGRRIAAKHQLRKRLEYMKTIPNKNKLHLRHLHKLERQCFVTTKGHRNALIKLLETFKLPFFVANGEAETLCALLQRSGHVDYTLSDDTDTLAYGCMNTVHMFKGSERYLIETDMDVFLRSKNMTRDEFLNACVLSGCDYLERISNIHIETCFEYVKKFHTLDQTLNALRKHTLMHDLASYEHVKGIYLFRTDTTSSIVKQHEQYHGIIQDCLQYYESDNTVVDHDAMRTLCTENGIDPKTVTELMRLITFSIQQFSLIRHNFFSKCIGISSEKRSIFSSEKTLSQINKHNDGIFRNQEETKHKENPNHISEKQEETEEKNSDDKTSPRDTGGG